MTGWLKSMHKSMRFAVPMVWCEPLNHLDDCCFCITNITGFFVQSKHKIEYANIPSALAPVPHDISVSVPEPLEKNTLHPEPESEEAFPEARRSKREDKEFSAWSTLEPHLITQAEKFIWMKRKLDCGKYMYRITTAL
jgi:hypothetical protein